MKLSKRAIRMAQRHSRRPKGSLNLVSLMDIFTILVFFLLVNSSDIETLPNARDLTMPESVAEQKPRETVVVMVTPTDILVEGERVDSVARVAASDALTIEPLREALTAIAARRIRADSGAGEITIMGDKGLPYRVLKKVMATCSHADYQQISLAVMQKGADAGPAG